jgi:hypothetical protein
MADVNWCGATWDIEDQVNGEYRCVVVEAEPTSGWHVGEHCWLTAQEIHPSST